MTNRVPSLDPPARFPARSLQNDPSLFPREAPVARSLTIQQEERAAVSPLFFAFLAFATAWLLLSTIWVPTEAPAPAAPAAVVR